MDVRAFAIKNSVVAAKMLTTAPAYQSFLEQNTCFRDHYSSLRDPYFRVRDHYLSHL